VQDAAAFDAIDERDGKRLPHFIRLAADRGAQLACSAVTLAEVCRGEARTRRAEVAISRDRSGRRVMVVPTDERLAKLVGSILYATHSSSDRIADAHVVAICAGAAHAVVITSDPDDIIELAAIPGTRIQVRRPEVL
jgi:predicted nucleic acid-binding protein